MNGSLQALGSAYFIRQNLSVQQWNFASRRRTLFELALHLPPPASRLASTFQPVVNCQIFAGNVRNAQTLRKEKYPREFFPEVSHRSSTNSPLSSSVLLDEMVSKRLYSNSLVNQWLVSTPSIVPISPHVNCRSSTFDLLNVHLFHDASNLLAAEHSPSIYSKCRRNALQYTLKKFVPRAPDCCVLTVRSALVCHSVRLVNTSHTSFLVISISGSMLTA